jgi:hypothetical protein
VSDAWVKFAAAAMQGRIALNDRSYAEFAAACARYADAQMVELDKRADSLAEPAPPWTWGRVEIFGRVTHLGRYRWTPGERFLDVEDLHIERKDGALVERIEAHRYGAKAVFSVSPLSETEVREAIKPHELPPRDAWRDPPPSERPHRIHPAIAQVLAEALDTESPILPEGHMLIEALEPEDHDSEPPPSLPY